MKKLLLSMVFWAFGLDVLLMIIIICAFMASSTIKLPILMFLFIYVKFIATSVAGYQIINMDWLDENKN